MTADYAAAEDPDAELQALQAQQRAATAQLAARVAEEFDLADAENEARHQEQAEIESAMWGLVEQQRRAFRGEAEAG